MVGKIAGGLSLFALGLLFYGERPTVNIQTCTNISIKIPIQPAMMALAGLAFAQSYPDATGYYHRRDAFRYRGRDVACVKRYLYWNPPHLLFLLGTAIGVVTEGVMIYLIS